MPVTLNFSQQVNTSLQVGDLVYELTMNPTTTGGFSTSQIFQPQLLGECIDVNFDTIVVDATSFTSGNFVLFQKDVTVNTSGIKGYYAKFNFKNNASTTKKVELFSVSSELSESRKKCNYNKKQII